MTKGSIEWSKISPKMKVVETRAHFEAAGKLVTWGSRDAREALAWLKKRVKADAERFRCTVHQHRRK
jgi:hypothetical protein